MPAFMWAKCLVPKHMVAHMTQGAALTSTCKVTCKVDKGPVKPQRHNPWFFLHCSQGEVWKTIKRSEGEGFPGVSSHMVQAWRPTFLHCAEVFGPKKYTSDFPLRDFTHMKCAHHSPENTPLLEEQTRFSVNTASSHPRHGNQKKTT